jgi:hypothetical protein
MSKFMENEGCYIDAGRSYGGAERHHRSSTAAEIRDQMEELRESYASMSAEELAKSLNTTDIVKARWSVRKIATEMFLDDNEANWGRLMSKTYAKSAIKTGNAVDSICWRCECSDKHGTACQWASRTAPRTDWKCFKMPEGMIRVRKCPDFQLNSRGWKDQEVVIWLISAILGRNMSVAKYLQTLTAKEMEPWVVFYNNAMSLLGASKTDKIGLRGSH